MPPKRILTIGACATLAFAGCDKDPAAPFANFALSGCPTGILPVNAPISLAFTSAVRPSTVSPANIIVTNATTGVEVFGGLTLSANGTQVVFTPSAPLPFGTALGIRVQNLLSTDGTIPLSVIVCNVLTEPPPIAEVVWTELDTPTGTRLLGASLYGADLGWVASEAVPLFKRQSTGWTVKFNQPYFASSFDVAFVSPSHGYATHFSNRRLNGVITETKDGGEVFDTVYAAGNTTLNRLFVDSVTSNNTLFGIAAGGSVARASFYKLNRGTDTWSASNSFSEGTNGVSTSQVGDVDFAPNDTLTGFAVSNGVRVNSSTIIIRQGRLFTTADGGTTWSEVAGAQADSTTITYQGVARRKNGDVFVAGGSGFFAKFAGGGGTRTRINLGLALPDSLNYQSLVYNDVQFAPDNDLIGFVVGSQLTGIVGGTPSYRGVIFGTKDGGVTWTRQGVRGAANYGAEIPALNRLDVYSSTKAWIVGDGGTVLSLNP